MKRLLAMLLVICVMIGTIIPANATDSESNGPAMVSDLDELLTAIEEAEWFDTIYLKNTIVIDRNCVIGKRDFQIKVAPAEDFAGDVLFKIVYFEDQDITIQSIYGEGGEICQIPVLSVNEDTSESDNNTGNLSLFDFNFEGYILDRSLVTISNASVVLERCNLSSARGNSHGLVITETANAEIYNTQFGSNISKSCGAAILCRGDVLVDSCFFSRNLSTNDDAMTFGGAIYVDEGASCQVRNSSFEYNYAKTGGAIYSKGELSLVDTRIYGNSCSYGGADIYIHDGGSLSIEYSDEFDPTLMPSEYIGFYLDGNKNRFEASDDAVYLGMKISDVPLRQYGLRFAFLSDFPEGYLAPESPVEWDNDTMSDLPAVQDAPTEDVPTTDPLPDPVAPEEGETPAPETDPDPTDPPASEDNGESDLPADDQTPPTQPETPAEPQEPEDGENNQDSNQTAPETPETPAEPQEPADNEDAPVEDQEPTEAPETPPEDEPEDKDTYTPPVIDRPTYRPPVIIQHPQEPTEKPAPALTCGDAVIDASRSVVLQGYGDGSLHEDDPLTRAQLATIIFRLLTDETIEKYGGGAPAFEDVPANAWHYQYVSTIARAGIVVGTEDRYYNPNGLVTWAQAITILSRFVEPHEYALVQIQYSGWALQAIQTAASLGWIEDTAAFDPDSVISRGELVSLVNGVLENYR